MDEAAHQWGSPGMKFFDDVRVGERQDLGRQTFSAADIKAFATRFDPQPFHLDEEAARDGLFGGLAASGWHTSAIGARLMIDYRLREAALISMRCERKSSSIASSALVSGT